MKILVLGATGYIGSNLMRNVRQSGVPNVVGCSTKDHNLMNGPIPDLSEFDTIINCAGKPDLDFATKNKSYRNDMWVLNGLMPRQIADRFSGHFIHVSSSFAIIESQLTEYAQSKLTGDNRLKDSKNRNIALVYPGWLYGGEGENHIEAVLRKSYSIGPMTVDNVKKANPTHIDYFCQALLHIAIHKVIGSVLVYDLPSMTLVGLANHIGVWRRDWTLGRYIDIAPRPEDWSYEGRFPEMKRCVKTEEGYHVRQHIQ